ncbi:MAG: acyl-CoA thioesterase [Anaerolineales bacterium]|nr:acyl-CoA thioesterase [Anaerolineales bacterium]
MKLKMTAEQNLPKEPESEVVARFQDCDPFGHLNNARYLDYFINAREDHLIHYYDLNIYEHAEQAKAAWVVSKTHIAYLRPVLVMEKVRIRTRVMHYSENSIVVEALMLDSAGTRLKSMLWVEFAYVSLESGRPMKHTPELMDLLQKVLFSDSYNPDGFNQRVDAVRAEVRGAESR